MASPSSRNRNMSAPKGIENDKEFLKVANQYVFEEVSIWACRLPNSFVEGLIVEGDGRYVIVIFIIIASLLKNKTEIEIHRVFFITEDL